MPVTKENRRMRPHAGKARARPQEVDAIAVALTAQIIICILILLGAGITKMADEERFAQIKQEYASLVGSGGSAGLSDYFAALAGLAGGFFGAVEEMISGLLDADSRTPAQPGSGGLFLQRLAMMGGAPASLALSSRESGMRPAPEGSTLAPFVLSRSLLPPVTGVITSPFAYRIHPISGELNFHNGIDIAAGYGQEILAALPGQVERVGEDEIYGKYVLLRHAHNLKTFYAHCSEILVVEGMRVRQGEALARVGDTGMTTGAHLHFAVIVEGLYADPLHGLRRHLQDGGLIG